MTLPLIITDAGRAAAVTASNTQAHVVINKAGLGSGLWSPGASATDLQNKIKEIDTVAGGNPGPGQMHFEIIDETEGIYTLGEFGLYLEDGTLFAIYSQETPILSKTAEVPLLLAADVDISTLPPGSVTFGNTDFRYPQATEATKGVDRIATQEEVTAGENLFGIVVPARLKAWWDSARTWANIKEKPTAFPPVQHNHAIDEVGLDHYVGMIGFFDCGAPPAGWLEANGGECPEPAAVLNTILAGRHGVGANGRSLLPDLRGEFVRGLDNGRGVDTNRELGSWQIDTMQDHGHRLYVGYRNATDGGFGTQYHGTPIGIPGTDGMTDVRSRIDMVKDLVHATGGTPRIANETHPRNNAYLACIYVGLEVM